MIVRAIILLALLAGIGWQLDREQQDGRFQQADDLFLDFLVANTRERFAADPTKLSDRVVFVRMREEDKSEFGAWPPPPIDWQMVLKGLRPFEPDVVVITTPLTWGQPAPEFVAEAGEALLPFTSVIGAEVKTTDKKEAASVVQLPDQLPIVSRVSGEVDRVPLISSITAMPDEPIRRQAELGLLADSSVGDKTTALPFVVSSDGKIVPSLALQALTRHTRTPYARQRLNIGPGAGAYLGGGVFVPLTDDGRLAVKASPAIAEVNALNFMTGALADGLTAEDKTKLGKSKIVVIGIDRDGGEPMAARLNASALAQTLALPRIHAIGTIPRWIICGVAALLGCLLLKRRGGKAFRSGLLLIFGALVVSYLTFQSQLTWFAPTVPAALLAASTLFATLFGKGPPKAPTAASQTSLHDGKNDA